MIFFLIVIIAILFYGMQVKPRNEFHTDYCSRKQTSTINGIFSLLIFLSHASQYTVLGGALDNPYLAMRKYLGQIVVASFLFYSGYGMMESINKKGTSYIQFLYIAKNPDDYFLRSRTCRKKILIHYSKFHCHNFNMSII